MSSTARVLSWLVPTLLAVLAAVLRLWNLGEPHELIFDETYYVKDAWSLLHLGYEGSWPDDPDPGFVSGDTNSYRTEASFVVHPPLGKWIIALGMALLGADSAWGWRLTTALAGTALVLLVYLVARELSGSIAVAGIAGYLIAIDGLAISMSRVALLDGSLALLVLLGFFFVLLDRRRTVPRLAAVGAWHRTTHLDAPGPPPYPPALGPVLWRRPWILAAGAALGAATAVKWSGLYALAALGIYLIVTDAIARRRAGVISWMPDAVVRQGPVTFLQLVPVAAAVYLVSWSGWFVTSGGYARGGAPNALVALWNYHRSIYDFHVGLATPHPYASPAWEWPLLLRPTAMWVGHPADADGWIGVISSLPNPVVWYAGIAAVIGCIVLLVRTRDNRYGFVVAGIAATYVPWLLYPNRTIFQFYTIAMLPFVVIGLALVLQRLTRRPGAADVDHIDDDLERELELLAWRDRANRARAWRVTTVAFLVLATLVAAFFLPIATGMFEPDMIWQLHNWLPGWV